MDVWLKCWLSIVIPECRDAATGRMKKGQQIWDPALPAQYANGNRAALSKLTSSKPVANYPTANEINLQVLLVIGFLS